MSFLDWLPAQFHLPRSWPLAVGLIVAAGIVIVLLVRRSKAAPAHGVMDGRVPESVTAQPRQIMDDSDVALLNLLSLVVRDHFLVLAKMPLRSLMQFHVRDDAEARVVAGAVRNITVDFVLVHPGTRRVVKALFMKKPGGNPSSWHGRHPWLDRLFRDAEIEIVRLDQEIWYNVEQLTELLGIKDEE